MRILSTAFLALLLLTSVACGGSSSSKAATGPLTGNWQLNLVQTHPIPQTQLSVSGFFVESSDALAGSLQGPTIFDNKGAITCGGVGQITGSLSGQNVNFSVSPGGTSLNFTGVISSDNTSMSGTYQAQGGACFSQPTTGMWSAFLVPPLNGNFTGTLSNSQYMQALTGSGSPAPITVSGTLTQTQNVGANNAGLTGTITAVGYPCFVTASLTGTISGNAVLLSVYGFNGNLIGSIGLGSPAVVSATSSGTTLTTGVNGLSLGPVNSNNLTLGPCPVIQGNAGPTTDDEATVALTLQ